MTKTSAPNVRRIQPPSRIGRRLLGARARRRKLPVGRMLISSGGSSEVLFQVDHRRIAVTSCVLANPTIETGRVACLWLIGRRSLVQTPWTSTVNDRQSESYFANSTFLRANEATSRVYSTA